MPRPKRTTIVPNYSDADALAEPEIDDSEVKKELGPGLEVNDLAEPEPEPESSTDTIDDNADTPSTPPPRVRTPQTPVSHEDGGEFLPENKAPGSPKKRKNTAPGSPSKAARTVKASSPQKSPTKSEGGKEGKFQPTPENRSAILAEMLKQVTTSRIDWEAVSAVTGDQPGKLAKVRSTVYYMPCCLPHASPVLTTTILPL
jgi:hypothetical protein